MAIEERGGKMGVARAGSASSAALSALEPLRARLLEVDPAERYRLLAALLVDLADSEQAAGNGRRGEIAEQVGTLSKRITTLGEEKASLEDQLATLRADLAHKGKQLEAEQERNSNIQKISEDQRVRLDAAKKKVSEMEAELVARNTALHKAEVSAERLQLQAQRAEIAAGDTSRSDALEEERRK